MLRDLPHVAPPEQIPGCVLAYDLSRYDRIAPAMSFLRENELVTDRELLPGILRVGANGKPTRALRDAFSTIREPVIMPAAKVRDEFVWRKRVRFQRPGALGCRVLAGRLDNPGQSCSTCSC